MHASIGYDLYPASSRLAMQIIVTSTRPRRSMGGTPNGPDGDGRLGREGVSASKRRVAMADSSAPSKVRGDGRTSHAHPNIELGDSPDRRSASPDLAWVAVRLVVKVRTGLGTSGQLGRVNIWRPFGSKAVVGDAIPLSRIGIEPSQRRRLRDRRRRPDLRRERRVSPSRIAALPRTRRVCSGSLQRPCCRCHLHRLGTALPAPLSSRCDHAR